MTERLYYHDCYTTEFSAQIVGRLTVADHPAVILDRTCFYPTGGGQPPDTGTIGDVQVIDVFADESGAVIHVLAAAIDADQVTCRVDWAQRFDHMQQHTGQHLLTEAFVQVANADTIGFHLSASNVTVDLDTPELTPEAVTAAEDLANRIVWENRPVTARLVAADEANDVRIRGVADEMIAGGLRVIEIDGFDKTACGGTHVARTGDVGVVKILRREKRGDKTRVEFCCGQRALRDYRLKNTIMNGLTSLLTCGLEEVEAAVERLRADLRQAHKIRKAAEKQLADYEAEILCTKAAQHGDFQLVKAVFADRDVAELRQLANRLVRLPQTIVFLGASGEKAYLLLARSEDLPHDMNALLQQTLPILGNARGGGQPQLAQGGGVKVNTGMVESALDAAEMMLLHS